jgi:hypothetical protein
VDTFAMNNNDSTPSAAEIRAEARRRRLALGNERLARIKALSTGATLPASSDSGDTSEVVKQNATSLTSDEDNKSFSNTAPDTSSPQRQPLAAASSATSPSPTVVQSTHEVSEEKPRVKKLSADQKGKPVTKVFVLMNKLFGWEWNNVIYTNFLMYLHLVEKPRRLHASHKAKLQAAAPSMTAGEQAILMHLKEREWQAGLKRWRWIHTAVFTLGSAILFFWILMQTSEIHFDGETIIANLLFGLSPDESVPNLVLFSLIQF